MLRTVITALQRLQDISSLKILHGNVKLGGQGKTVEINESMFGHKCNYNRWQISQGTWVFSMVERGTGRALAFRGPNRTRETLVAGLVQQFVEPGTTIISDKFSPYFNLNSLGYVHVMVNHSENFVDPFTGAHSNTVEGVWCQIKRKLKALSGTLKSKLPSYLYEFNWQKCYPGDPFDNLLADIADSSTVDRQVFWGALLHNYRSIYHATLVLRFHQTAGLTGSSDCFLNFL